MPGSATAPVPVAGAAALPGATLPVAAALPGAAALPLGAALAAAAPADGLADAVPLGDAPAEAGAAGAVWITGRNRSCAVVPSSRACRPLSPGTEMTMLAFPWVIT